METTSSNDAAASASVDPKRPAAVVNGTRRQGQIREIRDLACKDAAGSLVLRESLARNRSMECRQGATSRKKAAVSKYFQAETCCVALLSVSAWAQPLQESQPSIRPTRVNGRRCVRVFQHTYMQFH
eukprot:6213489-Pleurochrysis_carterae.AAC.4